MTLDIKDMWTAAIKGLSSKLSPSRLNGALAVKLEAFTKAHLEARETTHPNKNGWPSSNFWMKCAQFTHAVREPESVCISVSKIGAAQAFYGGDIYPVKAGALTIPACAEAYNHRAREFNDLVIAKALDPETGRVRPALVQTDKSVLKKGRKSGIMRYGGKVFYWLVGHVKTKPHRDVLPSDAEYLAACKEALHDYLVA